MAASMRLTTPEKLRVYLNQTLAGSAEDASLEGPVAAASEAAELYCRRRFLLAERTEDYDGDGRPTLVLRCRPVAAVLAVWDDAARVFDEAKALPASSYLWYPDEALLRLRHGVFPSGARNVRVRYAAGYETAPPALEQAANILAAHFYLRGRQGGDGLASESLGGYSVSYDASDWPASAKALLAEFREANM